MCGCRVRIVCPAQALLVVSIATVVHVHPHRPFKRPPVESMPSCAADIADEDDKENQDANTPPGTVRPPQNDAMEASFPDDAVAPLAQLRDRLLRSGGGSDGSGRASCASDTNDAARVRCMTVAFAFVRHECGC